MGGRAPNFVIGLLLLDPYLDSAPGYVWETGLGDQGLTQNGRCAPPSNPMSTKIWSPVIQKGISPQI